MSFNSVLIGTKVVPARVVPRKQQTYFKFAGANPIDVDPQKFNLANGRSIIKVHECILPGTDSSFYFTVSGGNVNYLGKSQANYYVLDNEKTPGTEIVFVTQANEDMTEYTVTSVSGSVYTFKFYSYSSVRPTILRTVDTFPAGDAMIETIDYIPSTNNTY